MKTLFVVALCVGSLLPPDAFAQAARPAGTLKGAPAAAMPKTDGCTKCAAAPESQPEPSDAAANPVPGAGRIENVIPIGVLTVLGCEKCSAEAVNRALQQGSSFDDIERTLQTVAAMQKLDCFKERFGPEVADRIEKPLAAAREALAQARARAAK